jgi:hypothetical protein
MRSPNKKPLTSPTASFVLIPICDRAVITSPVAVPQRCSLWIAVAWIRLAHDHAPALATNKDYTDGLVCTFEGYIGNQPVGSPCGISLLCSDDMRK